MLKQYKNNYKLINNLNDKCKILKNTKNIKTLAQEEMRNLGRSFKEIEYKIKDLPKKLLQIL